MLPPKIKFTKHPKKVLNLCRNNRLCWKSRVARRCFLMWETDTEHLCFKTVSFPEASFHVFNCARLEKYFGWVIN